MNLDTYMAAILATPKHVTETSLDLGLVAATTRSRSYGHNDLPDAGTLLQRLQAVQTLAEAEAREYGCNLYWTGVGIRLGKLRQGEKTSVGLRTKTAVNKPGYIGDFHVHPYEKKGSPEATIGPSWGDIEGWIDSCSHRAGLFMVFAGKALCITIFRDCTKSFDDHRGPIYTQMDYTRANDHGRQLLGEKTFNDGIMDYQRLEQLNRHMDSVHKERELWDKMPTYPREFSDANKELNRETATALRYEYFIADTSISPVTAALVSERVYKPSATCVLF